MKMPPLWSLGYQQNRYSYYPEAEVFRIAKPCARKRSLRMVLRLISITWISTKCLPGINNRFPDPAGMTKKLNSMGFKVTLIVDPGIKVEKGYGVYERGLKKIFLPSILMAAIIQARFGRAGVTSRILQTLKGVPGGEASLKNMQMKA
jgi:alpha-glucosidase (family GH31 glycosyl hydrolase)